MRFDGFLPMKTFSFCLETCALVESQSKVKMALVEKIFII